MLNEHFGLRLKFLRTVRNMTQAELAEKVGITPQYLGTIERGLSSPSFDVIEALARNLETTEANLFLFSGGAEGLDPPHEPQLRHGFGGNDPPAEAGRSLGSPPLDWTRYTSLSGFWRRDLIQDKTFWGTSLYQLLGYKPYAASPTKDFFFSHVHEDDLHRVEEAWTDICRGEPIGDLEFRFLRKDGSVRISRNHVDVEYDADDRPVAVYGFVLDITEWRTLERTMLDNRRQLEIHVGERTRKLKKMVRRLKTEISRRKKAQEELGIYEQIVNTAPDLMAFLTPDRTYRIMNQAYARLLEVAPGDVAGRPYGEILPPEVQEKTAPRLDKALGGKEICFREWFDIPDKGKRHLDITYTPFPSKDGPPPGVVAIARDITDIKQTQDALAESEERFRTVFEQAPLGIFTSTAKGRFLSVNPALARMLGYSSPQEVVESITDIAAQIYVHPERRFEVTERLRRYGGPVSHEMDYYRRDGSTFIAWLNVTRLEGDGGRGSYLLGMVEDVTERKLSEAALKESEGRFRTLFENAGDAIYVHEFGGKFIDANRLAWERLGYTREELLRLGPEEIDAPEAAALVKERTRRIMEDGRATFEAGHVTKDGRLIPVEINSTIIERQGKRSIISMVRDITDRKQAENALRQSEEWFRSLFDKAPLPYQSLDSEGAILEVNEQWLKTMGYAKKDVIGRWFGDFLTPAYRPSFRKRFSIFKEVGTVEGVEFEMARKNGESLIASFDGRVQREEQGGVQRTHCIFTDVTERKRQEAAVFQAKEEADAANRAKSQFLADMSHEIRTPLNGVMAMLQLMRMGELDGELKKWTDTAMSSGRALLSIINDVLDFSKIEAGKLELQEKPFQMEDLLETSLNIFYEQAMRKGVRLRLDKTPATPDRALGDPAKLRQILFNLVGNAVKFTDHGEVVVRVKPGPNVQRDGRLNIRFTVQDTGRGIPKQDQASVFEPFRQSKVVDENQPQGTGLGLPITRRLVELMGGSLGLDSEPGQGTTVRFVIPMSPLDDAVATVDDENLPLPEAPRSLNVLVAEDDRVSQMAVDHFLRQYGHNVTCVNNGQEVLEALAKKEFDCVLMDVQMPVMDGIEACAMIRGGHCGGRVARIPIVALTAYAMDGDRERFLAQGMDGYLAKPVDIRQMGLEINRVMRSTPS